MMGIGGTRPAVSGGGGSSANTSLVGIQTWKRTTAFSVPYNADTRLPFEHADFDEVILAGSQVVSAQPTGLIVQPGVSILRAQSQLYVGTTAELQASVWKNGSLYARGRNIGRGAELDALVEVAAGDVVQVRWFHMKSSGSVIFDPASASHSTGPFFATIEGYNP